MGHRFPLLRQRLPEGCLVRLMNALPTEWTDRKGTTESDDGTDDGERRRNGAGSGGAGRKAGDGTELPRATGTGRWNKLRTENEYGIFDEKR